MSIEDSVRRAKELLGSGRARLPLHFDALAKPVGVAISRSGNPQADEIARQQSNLGAADPQNWSPTLDPNVIVGALRDATGANVLQPHEGSASLILGFKTNVDLLMEAPTLLADLLEWYEDQNKPKTSQKPE